jgi:hypothetical protein
MSSKKKTSPNRQAKLQTIRIGSRVRGTDDGVEGRIVWANATSVKFQWEDGEQVTWRREELASKPVEILDAAAASNESPQTEASEKASASDQDAAAELAQADQEETRRKDEQVPAAEASAESAPQAQEQTPVATEGVVSTAASPTTTERVEDAAIESEPTQAATAKRNRKLQASGEPKEKKLSALDAAAKVLAESGQAMKCPEMIAAMAAKGYWCSPGGLTPEATLYSAILREITTKGAISRFVKAGRGTFALANGQEGDSHDQQQ